MGYENPVVSSRIKYHTQPSYMKTNVGDNVYGWPVLNSPASFPPPYANANAHGNGYGNNNGNGNAKNLWERKFYGN